MVLRKLPPRPRTNGPVIAVPPEKTMLPKVASRSPRLTVPLTLTSLEVIAIVVEVLGHVAAGGNGHRRLLLARLAELAGQRNAAGAACIRRAGTEAGDADCGCADESDRARLQAAAAGDRDEVLTFVDAVLADHFGDKLYELPISWLGSLGDDDEDLAADLD